MRYLYSKCVLNLFVGGALLVAQTQKNYKNRDEYELYAGAVKEIAASNPAKALEKLSAWKKQFPETDFVNERETLFVHAYAAGGQDGKAVDSAATLLDAAFATPAEKIKLLYTVCASATRIPAPTPAQYSTASGAAQRLANINDAPQGTTPAQWEQARKELHATARATIVYLALLPAAEALRQNDCVAAEAAAVKAAQADADSAQIQWYLGTSRICLARRNASLYPSAIYALARAAALDPARGLVDAKWQQTVVAPYLEKVYTSYHGSDAEGLRALKATAAASPVPPQGFELLSSEELEQRRHAALEASNPELALWVKIRAALAGEDGQGYFESSLKDAAVPALAGVVVDAQPQCRATELSIAIGAQNGAPAEIKLKLPKPLPGKPELNASIRWKGIPVAFSKTPFLLTMESDGSSIEGLRTQTCAPARRP